MHCDLTMYASVHINALGEGGGAEMEWLDCMDTTPDNSQHNINAA